MAPQTIEQVVQQAARRVVQTSSTTLVKFKAFRIIIVKMKQIMQLLTHKPISIQIHYQTAVVNFSNKVTKDKGISLAECIILRWVVREMCVSSSIQQNSKGELLQICTTKLDQCMRWVAAVIEILKTHLTTTELNSKRNPILLTHFPSLSRIPSLFLHKIIQDNPNSNKATTHPSPNQTLLWISNSSHSLLPTNIELRS